MELLPVQQTLGENEIFLNNPVCNDTIYMTIDFYKKVGFEPPWIGYYVRNKNNLVGACAFKGRPINGAVEIAYGVFEPFQRQGIASLICRMLVELSLATDPAVKITARTLPEENFSTRVLRKNNFAFNGTVNDPEDGDVWEWLYVAEN